MKKMTCSAMGGPCDAEMHAADMEAMVAEGMKHVEAAHPEMAAQIKAMPKEEQDKWGEEMAAKWAATPDEPAA